MFPFYSFNLLLDIIFIFIMTTQQIENFANCMIEANEILKNQASNIIKILHNAEALEN